MSRAAYGGFVILGAKHGLRCGFVLRSVAAIMRIIAVQRKLVLGTGFSEC